MPLTDNVNNNTKEDRCKGDEIKMAALLKEEYVKEYNIRDTKRFYSDINTWAASGIEIITSKGTGKELSKVSHISKETLDFLLEEYLKFTVEDGGFDEESGTYSIAVFNGINIYGEGSTKEEAIEDLLDSLMEYAEIYQDKIDIFSKTKTANEKAYMNKLIRCVTDRKKLRQALYL